MNGVEAAYADCRAIVLGADPRGTFEVYVGDVGGKPGAGGPLHLVWDAVVFGQRYAHALRLEPFGLAAQLFQLVTLMEHARWSLERTVGQSLRNRVRPSKVRSAHGTFGKLECEQHAMAIARACAAKGDTWQAVTLAEMKAATLPVYQRAYLGERRLAMMVGWVEQDAAGAWSLTDEGLRILLQYHR